MKRAASREFWERAWDYSQRVDEDASRKAESAAGRARLHGLLQSHVNGHLGRNGAALMPAFKTVALSRIQDAQSSTA